jgi:hypothetical protein
MLSLMLAQASPWSVMTWHESSIFLSYMVANIHASTRYPKSFPSLAGLAQPGKIERGARASGCRNHLHQLHVCLPAGQGRSRLLYRMSMDFLQWTKHVPFIQSFWAHIARQVSLLCCIVAPLCKPRISWQWISVLFVT